jgi:hypothetical protein
VTEDQIGKTGSSFFGSTQGPWYTVGWKISVLIEKTFGRVKLIECFCDQRKLLATYNVAAAKHNRKSSKPLAVWSTSLVEEISKPGAL